MDPKEPIPQAVAIPMKLDAFILNKAVCGGSSESPKDDQNKKHAKIAPISQPNYTFLRFERSMVQNDILNFTDLHKTGPARFNRRFTDLGTGETFPGRQGVYIHWIVPKPYRSGSTLSQDSKMRNQCAKRQGFRATTAPDDDPVPTPDLDNSHAPSFNPAPTRWLVIRKVEECSPPTALPKVDGWVVESDRRRQLDDIPTEGVDLQADFAPFLFLDESKDTKDLDDQDLRQQAEVFIGHKENASGWEETAGPGKSNIHQRVSLNLLNSSNQLFPDYQPHNSNVFSIIDPIHDDVKEARMSYYIVGWHSLAGDDPFGNLTSTGSVTRAERLKALNMALSKLIDTKKPEILSWLECKDPTRVVCHGAMYNVVWKLDEKPENVPADMFFDKLHVDKAVSVGTTPLHAILTHVKSRNPPVANVDNSANVPVENLERDLIMIEKFLHARDDGVDALDEAEDAVYNWNYSRSHGGSRYFLGGSDDNTDPKAGTKKPTKPDQKYIDAVVRINLEQRYIDLIDRQMLVRQWELFAFWWQYMSDLEAPDTLKTKRLVEGMQGEIRTLKELRTEANGKIKKDLALLPKGLAKPGVLPAFNAARDPTMLVSGIESGWPYDYLENLQVRLDTQLYVPQNETGLWGDLPEFVSKLDLPDAVKGAAMMLVGEFEALNPTSVKTMERTEYITPLYHDIDKAHALKDGTYPWRDRWENSQAWFPLFIEWIGEYTHIPCDEKTKYWTLDHRTAWKSPNSKLCYGISSDTELSEKGLDDKRTISGRVLSYLPEGLLKPEQEEELQNHLHELTFLSSPLSGFTDHLLTRVQGNHIKPSLRTTDRETGDSQVTPFTAAIEVGKLAGFGMEALSDMGIQTDLTPYASLVPYLDPKHCPFKPVTHGQFRFTGLNIIDKFGQAIHAIDPEPLKEDDGPEPLYPCVSEYYVPQPSPKNPNQANTVVKEDGKGNQYTQMPPSINQPTRLNLDFVDYFPEDGGWRPLTEWDDVDNYMWGWVLPNYVDNGIQLFLPDGTFFREIRRGGPKRTTKSNKWLPFEPPPSDPSSTGNIRQLKKLADALGDEGYLDSFMGMLTASSDTLAAPPSAYSEFLSSLVGRPLALVKAGYSLELATAPLKNTSTLKLGKDGKPIPPDLSLEDYVFRIQFGHSSRVYDGLVGYFLPQSTPSAGDTLDLTNIYTHFVPVSMNDTTTGAGHPTPNLQYIAPSNYPCLSPFFIDPIASSGSYTRELNKELKPIGLIIDPFTPLHAFTGLLPVAKLQLPAWTWQTALGRMTAFFHAGPLIMTADVPNYNGKYGLGKKYDLAKDQEVLPGRGVSIPGVGVGDWAWLQPYDCDGGSGCEDGQQGDDDDQKTKFMALGILNGGQVTVTEVNPPEGCTNDYAEMGGDVQWGPEGKVPSMIRHYDIEGPAKPLFAMQSRTEEALALFEARSHEFFIRAPSCRQYVCSPVSQDSSPNPEIAEG
ncbi:hypothetical protein AK830_g5113 [Neonectria ditissima]|uniref:Uncharacterized protein n=1 Tax=Neonectria ditissima TaxID=78410 RepID=A0A0P7B618_9HYPO|nr:hypothetical protein AK830_g5113 [Neonectria ditissima]